MCSILSTHECFKGRNSGCMIHWLKKCLGLLYGEIEVEIIGIVQARNDSGSE